MSRRASAKPLGMQMFPFLAVLICTMGALVVLLHVFARNGQVEARKKAEAESRAHAQEEELDADFFKWRAEHLREARAKTQAQLDDERLKLSHVEDHQRRLQEKLRELKLAVEQMERATNEKSKQREQNAEALAAAKEKLEETRAAVEEARRKGRDQRVSYSIVPYKGHNSTNRRPIYIECREELIVLQPEGIEFTPRDFVGIFGPGNPLAVALRAQREFFAREAPGGRLAEEPYPLMLVRPEGIGAYYAARSALHSWGSDFGYELVGSDWVLKFPPPNPRLADLTREVVKEARQQYRELVLSSPNASRQRSRPVYHANAHGGFSKEPGTGDGPNGSGLGAWDNYNNDPADAAGNGPGGPREQGGWGHEKSPDPSRNGELAQRGNSASGSPYGTPGDLMHRQGGSTGYDEIAEREFGSSNLRGGKPNGGQRNGGGEGQPGGVAGGERRPDGAQGAAAANGSPYGSGAQQDARSRMPPTRRMRAAGATSRKTIRSSICPRLAAVVASPVPPATRSRRLPLQSPPRAGAWPSTTRT